MHVCKLVYLGMSLALVWITPCFTVGFNYSCHPCCMLDCFWNPFCNAMTGYRPRQSL